MEYIPLINRNGAYNTVHVGFLPWINEKVSVLAYEYVVWNRAWPRSNKWFGDPSTPLTDKGERSDIQAQY